MWTSLPALFLPLSVLFLRGCAGFECPRFCRCLSDTIRCNFMTEGKDHRDPKLSHHLSLKTISSHSFEGLREVKRIEIAQSVTLETIEALAFNNLLNLSEISIQNTRSLMHIDRRAFNNLPKLHYLSISNTGITVFPDITSINSLESEFILHLYDNLYLLEVPTNAFSGMTKGYVIMNLYNNGIREIHHHAFNGTKIDKLVLKNNQNLEKIHRDAFKGAMGPGVLDVSATAISKLPSHGLESVLVLSAQSTYTLKSLPPLQGLSRLQEAHLTYNSHCCALLSWSTHRHFPINSPWNNISTSCGEVDDLGRVQSVIGSSADITLLVSEPDQFEENSFGDLDFHYPVLDYCQTQPIICTPEEDAFNPCEDIAGFSFLRVAIWFISILAITGNLMVLLVFFTSRNKLTVPRFLMCHLAFADLCIGIYLLVIATVDLQTRGHYSQHAIEWQTGPGCSAAGFLSVFGGELSVYTLSTITLERWHTITNALQVERHLLLTQAAGIMAAGWLLCLGMGTLPLVGVSSYTKVSMCLPMDIETPLAQAFIIIVLLLNVSAFIIVCVCYVLIFLAIKNPEFPERSADTRIAKRMAVLIFTDFLCMAPISFFAISAAFKFPLITVTNSKILLVLFFPINSCANPFLYAIFTKAFRKDAYQLMNAIGCWKRKGSVYRLKACCLENAIESNLRSDNRRLQAGMSPAVAHHQLQLNDLGDLT
ncbi:luteinizing hormone/choriogonadotropin receptor precursor [Kryptolebias marmoratus]|uniref:Lutropin-choriogonadotropic hormone receptor n=1 Tax=Kryptolebias marmoratus TaxID=37003 RepID=M4GMI4_KRYMA|nr:lutropin-choriogonadotropic hormone receptor precursor [Kryptolebias marmoratus]AER42421.1 luteinizing hormone receptor [Kryptolebias marmoratus]